MLGRILSHAVVGTLVFVVSAITVVGGAPRPAGTTVEGWIDTTNRAAVAVAFESEYGHDTPDMDWDGDYDACEPGASSDALRKATIRRVNFYRAMAGVPSEVILNEEYSAKAQHAALLMSATGELSHEPDRSFTCYSEHGREAAANSNLYLGRTGPRAVDGYVEDPGDRNRDVGHRNTLLHPPTREMGVGHVAGHAGAYPANALWVFDDGVFAEQPRLREPEGFVAWPPRGYVPPELVYPRWSFGLVHADFEQATVTMAVDGEPVELEVVARLSQQGYVPSPIIVWEPAAPAIEADRASWLGLDADTVYDITVDGVVLDGQARTYRYSVAVMGDRAMPVPVPFPELAGPAGS